jgi:hypothetical protein
MPDSTPNPTKPSVAVSVAILVIGLLILVPSGLCTGLFMFGPLFTGGSGNDMVGVALLIGGPFVVVGGALTMWGIGRLRR